MRLASKLAKLEQKAKVTFRCDWCRYALYDIAPTLPGKVKKENPADYEMVVCQWCSTEYRTSLAGLNERQREAHKLSSHKHDGEYYRDARAYAAHQWLAASRVGDSWRSGHLVKAFKRHDEKRAALASQRGRVQEPKLDRQQRARAEIKARALRFAQRMNQREEELYGPYQHGLPEKIERIQTRMKPSEYGHIPGSYSIEKMTAEEKVARVVIWKCVVMRFCERIVWNERLTSTTELFDEASAVVKRFVEKRARQARELEEFKRQKEEERRRQNEAYMARQRGDVRPEPQPPVQAEPTMAERLRASADHSDEDKDENGRERLTFSHMDKFRSHIQLPPEIDGRAVVVRDPYDPLKSQVGRIIPLIRKTQSVSNSAS